MDKSGEELWSLKKKDTGKVYAKLTFATVKAWILEARIDPEDLLTNQQLRRWVTASSVGELAPFFAPETMGAQVISGEDMGFGWQSKDNEEEEVGFDMTPIIDLTFNLLIFFMVTTTFSMHQIKKVSLPDSSTTVSSKPEKISVAIAYDQVAMSPVIWLGDEKVLLEELQGRLEEAVERTRQEDIMVAGDRELQYQYIVQVLDKVTKAGIKNINLKLNKAK